MWCVREMEGRTNNMIALWALVLPPGTMRVVISIRYASPSPRIRRRVMPSRIGKMVSFMVDEFEGEAREIC
jgi:hypothetical protein